MDCMEENGCSALNVTSNNCQLLTGNEEIPQQMSHEKPEAIPNAGEVVWRYNKVSVQSI